MMSYVFIPLFKKAHWVTIKICFTIRHLFGMLFVYVFLLSDTDNFFFLVYFFSLTPAHVNKCINFNTEVDLRMSWLSKKVVEGKIEPSKNVTTKATFIKRFHFWLDTFLRRHSFWKANHKMEKETTKKSNVPKRIRGKQVTFKKKITTRIFSVVTFIWRLNGYFC